MIWKEDSIVATFVDGKFETEDIILASYLLQFEECICLTPFVREIEEPPPNEHPVEEAPVEEAPVEEAKVEEAKSSKATKRVKK